MCQLSRPDRQTRQIDTVAKRGTLAPSQPGILACMAQSPHNADVLVVGAYTGSIGTYSLSKDATWLQGCQALVPQAHIGGVTHVRFDPVNEWRCGVIRINTLVSESTLARVWMSSLTYGTHECSPV
jgi:hypothetical protein